jgi:hypothetical protein
MSATADTSTSISVLYTHRVQALLYIPEKILAFKAKKVQKYR